MNIAVIAANGRSGKAFVEQALLKGHTVRAGVHGTNTLTSHSHLEVIQCDATDQQQVRALLSGQDAVVSFIGHTKNSPNLVQTNAMKTVIAIMQELGLKRIVSLTGTGVRFPGDTVSLIDRVLNLAVSFIDPHRVDDGKQHVAALQKSSLEWTVLRVLKLQNTKPKPFHLKPHGPAKLITSRDEVAAAALSVLEERSYKKSAPVIGR